MSKLIVLNDFFVPDVYHSYYCKKQGGKNNSKKKSSVKIKKQSKTKKSQFRSSLSIRATDPRGF